MSETLKERAERSDKDGTCWMQSWVKCGRTVDECYALLRDRATNTECEGQDSRHFRLDSDQRIG